MKRQFIVLLIMAGLCHAMLLRAQAPALRLVPYENENLKLYGYKDSATGKIVVPPKYDDANEMKEGMGRVMLDGQFGFVNQTGKLIVPCKYDGADDFSDGMARVNKSETEWIILDGMRQPVPNITYGYINKQGTMVIPFRYTSAYDFKSGLAPVELKEKWGYVNKTGALVIPMKYDGVSEFSDGFAIVRLNGKDGLIDKTGKLALPMSDWDLKHFYQGIYIVEKDRKYGLIHRNGKLLLDTAYSYIQDVYGDLGENALVLVKKDGMVGYINRTGKIVVPPRFVNLKSVGHPRLVCVYSSYDMYGGAPSICGLYSLDKDTLITALKYTQIVDFHEGMAAFSIEGKVGYLDEEGNERIPPLYEFAWEWKNGLGTVKKDGKMLLINRENQAQSSPYDLIFIFKNKLFLANDGGTWDEENGVQGGKYGLLDRDGKQLTPIKYDYMEEFNDGVARVLVGETLGLLDITGKEVLLPECQRLEEFSEGLAMVLTGAIRDSQGQFSGGMWGFINTRGEMVIPARFESCHYFSEGLAPVILEDKLGFIDKSGEMKIILDSVSEVGSFSEGYCQIRKNELIGYMDTTGKHVISCKYEEADAFTDGVAKVTENGTLLLIDKKGQVIRKLN